jgi:hypothetical protein
MHVPATDGTFAFHVTFAVHQRAFVLIFVKGHILKLVKLGKIQPHTPAIGAVVYFDHPLVILPGQRGSAFGAIHPETPEQTDENETIIVCPRAKIAFLRLSSFHPRRVPPQP